MVEPLNTEREEAKKQSDGEIRMMDSTAMWLFRLAFGAICYGAVAFLVSNYVADKGIQVLSASIQTIGKIAQASDATANEVRDFMTREAKDRRQERSARLETARQDKMAHQQVLHTIIRDAGAGRELRIKALDRLTEEIRAEKKARVKLAQVVADLNASLNGYFNRMELADSRQKCFECFVAKSILQSPLNLSWGGTSSIAEIRGRKIQVNAKGKPTWSESFGPEIAAVMAAYNIDLAEWKKGNVPNC